MNAGLLTAWRIWDTIYYHCTRLVYVDKRNHNIFRVVVKKYRGSAFKSGGQSIISYGDYYVKLHIHNCQLAVRLRGANNDMRLGLIALKEVRNSLPALAAFINNHPQATLIKGVVGTTILYRGAKPLGFHIQEIDSRLFRSFKTLFFKFILSLSHPNGFRRLRTKSDQLVAKRVFMSKEALLERYLESI